MRRLTERGASLIGIGIRSLSREESDYANGLARVDLYRAQDLANRHDLEAQLLDRLRQLAGSVYLTFDVDALTPALCPATGTPEPGGLGWWQTLKYLRALLRENRARQFRGCDVVETVPANETRVNEFTAARLIAKVLAYFAGA
jgi:agmatinase